MKIENVNVYTIKRLWNRIILDGLLLQSELERMMDNSFTLVVSKMAKRV
ncbi:hypothetical protein [Colwellia sp. 75C3]|nr:hypothetical protein [Colwellia sp. 75C3]